MGGGSKQKKQVSFCWKPPHPNSALPHPPSRYVAPWPTPPTPDPRGRRHPRAHDRRERGGGERERRGVEHHGGGGEGHGVNLTVTHHLGPILGDPHPSARASTSTPRASSRPARAGRGSTCHRKRPAARVARRSTPRGLRRRAPKQRVTSRRGSGWAPRTFAKTSSMVWTCGCCPHEPPHVIAPPLVSSAMGVPSPRPLPGHSPFVAGVSPTSSTASQPLKSCHIL